MGPVFVSLGLAIVGVMAGCQTAPKPGGFSQDEYPLRLSRSDAEAAEALANFGMGMLREGLQDSAAVTNYARAVQLEPARIDFCLRIAAVHIKHGENAKAIAVMQEACKRNPRSFDAWIYLAQVTQALKEWDTAQKACLQAIRIAPRHYRGYVQSASVYRDKGDEARALTTLEDALDKVEDKRPLLRFLGDIYAQRVGNIAVGNTSPDLQKAIEYYQRLSLEPPDDFSLGYLQQLGDLYFLTRQIENAISCFAAVAARQPDDIQVQKKLAVCYMTRGDKEKAIQSLKAIANREPQNAEIQYYLGELYENLADITNAVSRFTSACEGMPTNPMPYIKLAILYMKTDPERASQILQSGLKQIPEDQKILELLAQIYVHNQYHEEAMDTLDRLKESVSKQNSGPLASRMLLHYGVVSQNNKLDEAAASFYQGAIEQDPSFLDPYVRLAFLYLSQDRKDETIQVMERVAQVLPDDVNVYYFLGLLYSRLEHFHEAIEAFEKVEEFAANDPQEQSKLDSMFFFNYGAAYERVGQYPQAETLLQYAILLDTDNINACNYVAYMWAERGTNLVQALEYISHALDGEPENGAFIDTLGWIYFKQNRYEEALESINNALCFIPDDPTIMEHMGDVLAALHRDDDALVWWKRSYQFNLNNKTLEGKLKERGVNLNELRDNARLPTNK